MQPKKSSQNPDKQVRIKIVCPWWGRVDVVKMHCLSMVNFMKQSPFNVTYLAIISKEDKDFTALRDLAFRYKFDLCCWENYPVSVKLNAGIEIALEERLDYIMNMGSDDLCSPEIWEVYRPYIEKRVKFFGIDSCHIVDFYSNEAFYLDLYNDNLPVGVLRMIRADVIRDMWTYNHMKLYPYGINRGMDGASGARLKMIGVLPEVIHTNWRTFTTGVKCNTSINHFMYLSALDRAKKIEFNELKHLFT